MIEHCLYGHRVLSEFELFDWSAPQSGPAPGEHRTLELKALPEDFSRKSVPFKTPLYWAHDRELFLYTDRQLARSVRGQAWRFEVASVLSIHWIGGEPAVYYELERAGTRQLLVFWFVHIFMPLYLTLERGYDFLHSASVEIADVPVLFIAPSTGGKSTLGDYFLRQGHCMLSDDKVATVLYEGEFYAVPSHPHHRPFRQYEVLGNPVRHYASRAQPIRAFYVLEPDDASSAITISEVSGFRKFEQLLPHYLYGFSFLQEQRLQWLARLVEQTPVFVVSRPWDLAQIDKTYAAICRHFGGLPQRAKADV